MSQFDLSNVFSPAGYKVNTIEGVTIDFDGNIYLAAELGGGPLGRSSAMVVLAAPVPEPETYAMMIAGLAAVGALVRRRRNVPTLA